MSHGYVWLSGDSPVASWTLDSPLSHDLGGDCWSCRSGWPERTLLLTAGSAILSSSTAAVSGRYIHRVVANTRRQVLSVCVIGEGQWNASWCLKHGLSLLPHVRNYIRDIIHGYTIYHWRWLGAEKASCQGGYLVSRPTVAP